METVNMTNQSTVIEKIKIHGDLTLISPLLIGAGDGAIGTNIEIDSQVLKDKNNQAFIPGTSLAGVLRHWVAMDDETLAEELFGRINEKVDLQSAITINDIVLKGTELVVRDGVSIDGVTNTAIQGAKYDYEAVERGATGKFEMEVTLRKFHEIKKSEYLEAVKRIAGHMIDGVRLGALTAKGFGKVACANVQVEFYDFTDKKAVSNWILGQTSSDTYQAKATAKTAHSTLSIDVDCAINSALIVRDQADTEEVDGNKNVASVQKKSGRDFVIPGTTVKGVLRHHAEYILRTLGIDTAKLNGLMGTAGNKEGTGNKSKFVVDEVYIQKGLQPKLQSRNRIDRFTGGTIDSALFTTQPIWQKDRNEKTVHLHYEIQECEDWQAGLALFVLKDLCTGRIAFGGEKSVGRGTMKGLAAKIAFQGKEYELNQQGAVANGNSNELETYAKALACMAKGGKY